ncbi:MAG: hypothetical protein JJT94_06280 [Bernardetiaceae bacterium]|nr:hypothetical protein [Bernardetiaceae bacterium]
MPETKYRLQYLAQTSTKMHEPEVRKNEDAYKIPIYNTNSLLLEGDVFVPFAVSDGAGGTGIFASEWSEHLIKHLPKKPMHTATEVKAWIDKIWEEFYDKYAKMLESDSYSYAVRNKFFEQGSAATIAACWFDSAKAHWLTYGDSCIFVWDSSAKILESIPYTQAEPFAQNPFLLNWATEAVEPEILQSRSFSLAQEQTFILATDALSLYLILEYIRFHKPEAWTKTPKLSGRTLLCAQKIHKNGLKSFEEVLTALKQALISQEAFTAFCHRKYQAGEILNDDYTMVWVEVEEATKKTNSIFPKEPPLINP